MIMNEHKALHHSNNKGEIILYQPDNSVQIDVRIEDETVWLTQAQMVVLFQSTKQNISLHVNNIYKENELDYKARGCLKSQGSLFFTSLPLAGAGCGDTSALWIYL